MHKNANDLARGRLEMGRKVKAMSGGLINVVRVRPRCLCCPRYLGRPLRSACQTRATPSQLRPLPTIACVATRRPCARIRCALPSLTHSYLSFVVYTLSWLGSPTHVQIPRFPFSLFVCVLALSVCVYACIAACLYLC